MNRGTRDGGGGGGVPHFMGNIFGRRRRVESSSNENAATAARSPAQDDGDSHSSNNNNDTAFADFVEGVFDAASEALRFSNPQPSATTTTSTTIPPASAAALQQLPQITVRPCDLRDPANRECCICLDEIVVGTTVARLPYCAHLFHSACAHDWLRRHGTCPTCRYELPTDCPAYEVGRRARMQHWKPRYARHELQALRVKELKQLLLVGRRGRLRQLPAHIKDKTALIEYLIQQTDCIDLIPGGDEEDGTALCAFRISVLQQMSVRELKHVMNEGAGVFFDPKEVLEKQDMIRIFVASGRLQVVPEQEDDDNEEDDCAPPTVVRSNNNSEADENHRWTAERVFVETVYSDTEEENDNENVNGTTPRVHTGMVMEENRSFLLPKMPSQVRPARPNRDDDGDDTAAAAPSGPASTRSPAPAPSLAEQAPTDPTADADSLADSAHVNGNQNLDSTVSASTAPATTGVRADAAGTENFSSATSTSASSSSNESLIPLASFQNLSVSQAQTVARQRGVDISDLLEERDRLDRSIAERLARATPENGSEPSSDGECPEPHRCRRSNKRPRSAAACPHNDHAVEEDASSSSALHLFLQDRSVAQLRAIAREKSVDFSRVLEKSEMIDRLLDSWPSAALSSNASGRG